MIDVSSRMFPASVGSLFALGATLLCVSGEDLSGGRSGLIHELQAALADLGGQGRTYLGRLAGDQTVLSVQKVRESKRGSFYSSHTDALSGRICFVGNFN